MFPNKVWLSIIVIVTALILGGCGGGGSDNVEPPPPPPPPNTITIPVSLSSLEVITGGALTGSATVSLTLNLDDNTLTGTVTLDSITADTVTLNQGFSGEQGEIIFNLQEDSSSSWSLSANSTLTSTMLDQLNNGELYIKVINTTDGALRGQIITGDIQLLFTSLSGSQEVPVVTTTGSAKGSITLNPDSGAIVVHLNASGLDDANASHIHQGLAGLNGPVVIGLLQDSANPDHWSATDSVLDSALMASLNKGELYLNLHTPAQPGGEVRGQIEPEGIEVVFTTLTGGNVVPAVTTSNSGSAATTINSAGKSVDMHVNLQGLDDASDVTVNQAPVGQNGPVALTLTQDGNNLSHWSLANMTLPAGQYAALQNQGLYFTAASPVEPNGEVRGQLITKMSTAVGGDTLVVSTITPANGATVADVPGSIVVTFNRELLSDTVVLAQVELLASGDDGGFSDGNEVTVTAASVVAGGSSLTIDLSGVINVDDVYQLTLDGSGTAPIVDSNGVVLDGDGDNNAGGDFISTFIVSTPVTPFVVSAITPANGASVEDVPASIVVTFNRAPMSGTVSLAQVELLASGGDGGFSDGNEVTVTAASVVVSGSTLTIDLSGVSNVDDVYQLTLDGSGVAPITDSNGVVLDGDGDSNAGGDFISTFTVVSTPVVPFVVSAIIPANGASVEDVPASIVVTFNRALMSGAVSLAQVELLASGNDGGFSDGNEVTVTAASVVVSGSTLTIDLSGVSNVDDVYQLTLDGSGVAPITDSNGVVLDGDGDSNAGGDFISTFTVSTPPDPVVTLSMLKTEIFTPTCALSGCHAGAFPQEGMNLSADVIFSNIVGMASTQVPSLNRVEPGDPDNSYLVRKIEGTASVGVQMPESGPPLTNEEIQKIRQWIADGAKDD